MHIFFLLSFSSGNSNGKDRALAALLFVCLLSVRLSKSLITGETISATCQHLQVSPDSINHGNGWNGKQLHIDREASAPFCIFQSVCVAPLDWTSVANSLQNHSGNTTGNRNRGNLFKDDMCAHRLHYRLHCCGLQGTVIIRYWWLFLEPWNSWKSETLFQVRPSFGERTHGSS